jgi:choline dehydrogenase-like flavoprotein
MANHAGPRTFGVLGQIVPRCANMYEAFRQAERYCALASQGGRLNVARDASTLSIKVMVEVPPGPVRSTILLWAATNLAFLPERVTGAAARPKMIACSFAAPGAEATRALSTLCPFSFASRETRVSFDQGVGDLAIPSVDADLKALLADDQRLETFVRSTTNGIKHLSCTCRMGRADDPLAVTDTEGRVRGVGGLRVVDASSMPSLPRANSNLATLMLAEKLSDAILGAAPRRLAGEGRVGELLS